MKNGRFLSQLAEMEEKVRPSCFCCWDNQDDMFLLTHARWSFSLWSMSSGNISVRLLLSGSSRQLVNPCTVSGSERSNSTKSLSDEEKAVLLLSDIPSQSSVKGTWIVPKKYEGGSVLILHRLVKPLLSGGHWRRSVGLDTVRAGARSNQKMEARIIL